MTGQPNPETTPTVYAPTKDISQTLPDVQERPKSRLERLLSPFRRVTSNGQYIPVIDGLRFVAIMMVVMYHLNDYIVHKRGWVDDPEVRSSIAFQIFNAGNVGVQLFFAISGFILALPFIEKVQQGKPLGLKKYFLRRLTRLEPPYIINLTIVLLLLIFWKGQSFSDLIGPYFASLFYVHNIVYGEMSRINGVAWSLEIEVQFYILAPFLFAFLFRVTPLLRRALLVILIAIGSLDFVLFGDRIPPIWNLAIGGQFEYFLVGVMIADVSSASKPNAQRNTLHDTLAILAIIGLITFWNSRVGPFITPVAIAVFVNSAIHGRVITHLLSGPLPTTIGGTCYTVYLYHFYIISAANIPQSVNTTNNLPILIPIISLLVCTACLPIFAATERPFMKRWRLCTKHQG